MKQIVFARIDDRLIHGQVMTAWLKQCDANEVVIIDNELCKDTFVVMMMKSLIPSTISLKVFNDTDAAAYLKGGWKRGENSDSGQNTAGNSNFAEQRRKAGISQCRGYGDESRKKQAL
mgnify:CR=1 FL=1